MARKVVIPALFAAAILLSGCCGIFSPMVDPEQPEQRLYQQAGQAMRDERFQEAATLYETIINTYPESEYVPRAETALYDIWYAQGGVGQEPKTSPGAGESVTFFPPLKDDAAQEQKTTISK